MYEIGPSVAIQRKGKGDNIYYASDHTKNIIAYE